MAKDNKKLKRLAFDRYLVRRLKFRKMVFSDKSEYWFEKRFQFPVFGRIRVEVDTERLLMMLEVESKVAIQGEGEGERAVVDYAVKNEKQVKKILRMAKLIK